MQANHNTLEMDGPLLSALIDPKYTLSDIFQYWRQIALATYEGRRNLPFGLLWANDESIWIGSDHYSYDGKALTSTNIGPDRILFNYK